MTPEQVIEKILLGGLLGLLGQGIRMAIGLKKLSDGNAHKEVKEDLNGGRLLVSLFIGFVAGALYVLVNGFTDSAAEKDGEYVGNQFVFTVIAAGYAGSDFIEGLFNTYLAKLPTPNSGGGNKVVAINPLVVPSAVPDTTAADSSPLVDVPDNGKEPDNVSGHIATSA